MRKTLLFLALLTASILPARGASAIDLALVLLTDSSTQQWGRGGMAEFYRRDVIGGPGSFMVEVHDFSDFGEALKRKLLLELVTPDDKDGRGVRVRTQTAAVTN